MDIPRALSFLLTDKELERVMFKQVRIELASIFMTLVLLLLVTYACLNMSLGEYELPIEPAAIARVTGPLLLVLSCLWAKRIVTGLSNPEYRACELIVKSAKRFTW